MEKDILFLCQFFYPEYNSSATLPFDTAKYLAANGYKVGALCGYPKEYSNASKVPLHEIVDGVDIHRLKYVELDRKKTIGRLINYFSFTAAAVLNISELRKYKSVIVYSNPPILPIVPLLAKKLFHTKFVFVAYDVYPEVAYASKSLTPGDPIDKVMKIINRKLYKKASGVVALTEEMQRFLLDNRKGLKEKKTFVIPNWAHEKETAVSNDAYSRFGYTSNQFVVSYFGNMGTCQDMDTLMGAAERLKDNENVRFLIVGHGNKKDSISDRIKEKGLNNVQLMDFLTGEDFEKAVAVSSCCVASLEKGLMGTCAPSKYYSYLQGGHPVLAVVEPESYLAKEVEEEHIGYAVPVGDSEKLEYKILAMASNTEAVKEMGMRAKALYANNYDIEICLKKYVDLFKEILR